MTLIKWKGNNDTIPSPFSNWMDDFFNQNELSRWQGNSRPSVNVKETDKSFVLEVAAPGFDKNDFSVDVENDILTISAKTESRKEENDKHYTRREFNYNAFSRSFTLPESVNSENINGTYKNGILTVELPKKPEATKIKKSIKVS